ncbi:cationic amino acid transporter [Klebsormidium nitens]|uniref:Cationic amino acid transporter n=1 Tax=Klebsormidium nitens TaxID=105231 RepID=A0A1Y1I489_KLENI|nr:cationic amino acid transporter [Klebsormidium nitens]|eukprot:GAQ85754.1 cationic amino acid transporter [Klebsormidium nitens]
MDSKHGEGAYGVDHMTRCKQGFAEHITGLVHTPSRLHERFFARRTIESQLSSDKAESGAEMVRKLWWLDMIIFGVGSMVGAGVFVITGVAANELSGPSVILSYIVSGISALLSAFCYTEFAVQLPVGGAAFAYVALTFGEFPAYLTAAMLLMEYVLSRGRLRHTSRRYATRTVGSS